MEGTLSLEGSRELLCLCKAGKLYQVEEWIRQGKSLTTHPKSGNEPLRSENVAEAIQYRALDRQTWM